MATVGPGRPQPAAAATGHSSTNASRYHSLSTPRRLVDTRLGLLGIGRIGPEQTVLVPIAGAFEIPSVAQGVTAVVASVTVTDTDRPGYLTVYPAGDARPLASNLNWGPGETHANLVEVAIQQSGPQAGYLDVYVNNSAISLIIDLEGWYQSDPGPSGLFRPLTPQRLLDTRIGTGGTTGPIAPQATIALAVAGVGDVPANASAVAINLTETDASGPDYLAVFPLADGNSGVSNLNFVGGQTRAVRAVVRLDGRGYIGIYNASASVQVLVDVSGWFTDSSNPGAAGGHFIGTSPTRILDTRVPGTAHYGALGPNSRINLPVATYSTVPAGASAVVMNLTLAETSGPTYELAFAAGGGRPLASDINFAAGGPVPNLDVTPLSADGSVTVYNSANVTQVIADVVGYYDYVPGYVSPPAAPSLSAATGDHQVRVSWTPPADTGGTAIVSYDILVPGLGDIPVPGSQTTYLFDGLSNQTTYTMAVVALNGTGTSPAASLSVTTPVGTPDAVTGITYVHTAGAISLSWQTPLNNGGAAVFGYYVWVSPAPAGYAEPIGTDHNGIQVAGLDPNVGYSFTIRALNSYGQGLPAYFGPVRPGPVAAAPARLRIPALGINAAVESVAMTPGGDLGSPSNSWDVAWENQWPSPGEYGDALMTGHVDWYDTSCAVFCHLTSVTGGMDVFVDRVDGSTGHFVVDGYNYYGASSPPSWLFDRNGNGVASLSLVTCAGDFVNGGYTQRFVVHTHAA
ncbi:MAG TPA: fibronectin type III domain-containing protein [Candidatus Dormibacteraeota bacterium]